MPRVAYGLLRCLCVVVAASALFAPPAHGATTTWEGFGTAMHADFNWTNGVPGPTFGGPHADTAIFGPGGNNDPFAVQMSIPTIIFSANAQAYTVSAAHEELTITGGGVINLSPNRQTLVSARGRIDPVGHPNEVGQWEFRGVAAIFGGPGGVTILTETSTSTRFRDDSRAGNATILNQGAAPGTVFGGGTSFGNTSSASFARITNSPGDTNEVPDNLFGSGVGVTGFAGSSTAASAVITNEGGAGTGRHGGGVTRFSVSASAGQAVIVNLAADPHGLGGLTNFTGDSSATSATIINTGYFGTVGGTFAGAQPGRTLFLGDSSAGNATIFNGAGGLVGGTTIFKEFSTAGNATITSNGSASGEGGVIRFTDFASGGNATVSTGVNGIFDISGLAAVGTGIGSIAGAGHHVLGGKQLLVGSNHISTTVSGLISGVGGALRKTGNGNLTLTGANTYTGFTSIFNGSLIVNNPTGSATGTGTVFVNPGGTLAGGNPAGTRGFIAGNVLVAPTGRIAPGLAPASAGLLTILDDLDLSNTSVLELQLLTPDLFSAVDNDRLSVAGDLALDGILDIDTASGFGGLGAYLLIAYGGALTDDGLALGALPAGFDPSLFSIDVSQPGEVILRVGRTRVPGIPVPTPTSAVLLLAAGLLLVGRGLIRRGGAGTDRAEEPAPPPSPLPCAAREIPFGSRLPERHLHGPIQRDGRAEGEVAPGGPAQRLGADTTDSPALKRSARSQQKGQYRTPAAQEPMTQRVVNQEPARRREPVGRGDREPDDGAGDVRGGEVAPAPRGVAVPASTA